MHDLVEEITYDIIIQANPEEYKKQIAYVPETPILYDELTLREHIDLTIMAYELDHDEAWQRATKLLKLFRLDNKLDWFPANFSKGMKQKVMICCAFMTALSYWQMERSEHMELSMNCELLGIMPANP